MRRILKPRRALTNLLVVYDLTSRYHRYAGRLNLLETAIAGAQTRRRGG